MKIAMVAQHLVTGVGVASSATYVLQSWHQIKVHGLRHWMEAGFEKLEDQIDDALDLETETTGEVA